MKYHGDMVREKIIDAALKLWKEKYGLFNASDVGRSINMHRNAVLYHYSIEELIDRTAQEAVVRGESAIIVQLIGMKHHAVHTLLEAEKLEHFRNVLQINRPY